MASAVAEAGAANAEVRVNHGVRSAQCVVVRDLCFGVSRTFSVPPPTGDNNVRNDCYVLLSRPISMLQWDVTKWWEDMLTLRCSAEAHLVLIS